MHFWVCRDCGVPACLHVPILTDQEQPSVVGQCFDQVQWVSSVHHPCLSDIAHILKDAYHLSATQGMALRTRHWCICREGLPLWSFDCVCASIIPVELLKTFPINYFNFFHWFFASFWSPKAPRSSGQDIWCEMDLLIQYIMVLIIITPSGGAEGMACSIISKLWFGICLLQWISGHLWYCLNVYQSMEWTNKPSDI